MKKAKILGLVLALVLIASLAVLIVSAEGETSKPEIVYANIAYDGDYAIMLAIDSVKGGGVSVQVWDEDGTDKGTFTAKKQTINGKEYYVVKTPGIAQNNMGKVYSYQAIDAEGNEGDVKKISVAQYFYQRLFLDGFVDKTDGTDALRKQYYIKALDSAALLQQIIGMKEGESLVTDLIFAYVPGYKFDVIDYPVALLNNKTTEVTLPEYTGAVPNGRSFEGYRVTKYDEDFNVTYTLPSAGETVTIDAHTVVTALFDESRGSGRYFNTTSANGKKWGMEDSTLKNNYKEWLPRGSSLKQIPDFSGKSLLIDRVASASKSYLTWQNTDFPLSVDPEEGSFAVFEFDVKFEKMPSEAVSNIWKVQLMTGTKDARTGQIGFGSTGEGQIRINLGDANYSSRVEQGEWNNFRFEVESSGQCRIYLNGKLQLTDALSDVCTLDNPGNHTENRMEMQIVGYSETVASDFYIDNVFLGRDTRTVNQNAVWGDRIHTCVVVPEGEDSALLGIASDFAADIYNSTGNYVTATTYTTTLNNCEIVIGEITDRPVSVSAYAELNSIIGSARSGYVIYAADTSIAIAYDSKTALNQALKYIIDTYGDEEELVFSEAGVLHSETYSSDEFTELIDTVRTEAQDAAFAEIEAEYGQEITDGIKDIFALYSTDTYKWIAGLYDSEIGGFYFSNSAKVTDGYLPDIESTYQALAMLESVGMFSDVGGYEDALPKEMKEEILEFAKSLQSRSDGYFYHPQWKVGEIENAAIKGDSYKDSRRGRDLGWATSIITTLGSSPYYDTPNGLTGGGAPATSEVALTARLRTSVARSVAVAVSANTALPTYLQSLDAWKAYIEDLKVQENPYEAGNTLAAQHNEIKAAGTDYIDYLTGYLEDIQNETTGFWGKDVSYATMNGFMKLAHSFAYYDKEIPNADKALDSTMTVLKDLPNQTKNGIHICTIFNPWSNFNLILSSAKRSGGEAYAEELRDKILADMPELLEKTCVVLSQYRRTDEKPGGFSYYIEDACHSSQGAPVACATSAESDMNATNMGLSEITGCIFSVLGVEEVPIFVPEDADVFFELLGY